jgi:CheY-like chemotaxis protein
VLVVDDEEPILVEAQRQLERLSYVEPLCVGTQDAALAALNERYVDAAIVDIGLDKEAGGYEVLRGLGLRAPHACALIATKYTDIEHTRQLMTLVGTTSPIITRIIEKRNPPPNWMGSWVAEHSLPWRERGVVVDNLDLAVGLLMKRKRRIPSLRANDLECAFEVDRLCRELFGRVTGVAENSHIEVRLSPIDRQGLSAAITVEAEVNLGRDAAGHPVRGSRCVLKLGGKEDIRGEVERYHRFVKHGVRLTERVELLGHASDGALGAICYSFAGGLFGRTLRSLDELLHEPDGHAVARATLQRLFDVNKRSWYGVACEAVSPMQYLRESYGTDFDRCYRTLNDSGQKIANRVSGVAHASFKRADESTDAELLIDGVKLVVPRLNRLGDADLISATEACLVHGDMHGGNVMVELDDHDDTPGGTLRRVCLIDYRNAGPGPRCIDAVALEASARLADVHQIVRREVGESGTDQLDDASFARAARACAARVEGERQILSMCWDRDEHPNDGGARWATLAADLVHLTRRNFPDLRPGEYQGVALLSALRHLGYAIGALGRVRIMAWITALNERSA